MDAEWEGYLVYDTKSGEIRGATTSAHEAASVASYWANEIGEEEFVWDAALPQHEDRIAANPEDFLKFPQQALKASRLPVLGEREVMGIDLADAVEVLGEEFRESYRQGLENFPLTLEKWKRQARARGEHRFDYLPLEWRGEELISNLLRTNYKLEKDYRDPNESPAYIKGLNLVPAFSVFSGVAANDAALMPVKGLEESEVDARRLKIGPERPAATLCLGANRACMSTCLVYTGNNAKSVVSLVPKQAAARALVKHPQHFTRVLVEAIERFMNPRRVTRDFAGFQRYVRLNVISDVPWELVAPWIFERFPGTPYGQEQRAHFAYDYTKVVGRNPPSNYDLTFSFSGTNYSRAAWELDRGRRVAVVFFFPEVQREFGKVLTQSDLRKQALVRGRARMYRDATWLGRPVVDGDQDDVRPRDPGGVWVGLTWKPAKGWAGRTPSLFVLYAVKIDGNFTVAVTPRHIGVPTEDLSEKAIIKTRRILGAGRKLPTELREES